MVEVVKGNVIQEVSETGQVQMGKAVNLSFKNAGTLQAIFIKVGDKVWPGTNLARLSTVQLVIERNEAQAAFDIAQAKLDQLLTGATPEAIQAAQTDVYNAEINLENVEQEYAEDLNHAYEDASNALDSAYLKISGALTTVTSIRKSYFYGNDQESITVKSKEDNIEILVDEAKESIDNDDVDTALSVIKDSLGDVYDDLGVTRDMAEVANYADIVSASDKASLDTERLNINTALTNIINAQQVIALAVIDGEADISNAEGDLQEAQDDLALTTAEPSKADTDLYEAQVAQAQAKVDLFNNRIWEATLRSPIQGQVIEINKEVGEMVQPSLSESVITLLPETPYEIEVDIYEEDVVKMDINNRVDISLIAFPDETFPGKVISINPAEELIENVVYYTATISFEDMPEGIRPGMTADLLIEIDSRENVLIIPEDAILEKDGKSTVQIYQAEKIEEREIEIGLIGSDEMVEVVSGLQEGEQVIVE